MKKFFYGSVTLVLIINFLFGMVDVYAISTTSNEIDMKLSEENIELLDPTDNIPVEINRDGDTFTSTGGAGEINIPINSDNAIEINNESSLVEMSIPIQKSENAELDGNTVIYHANNVSIGVQSLDGGVRELINIENSSAPREYKIDFSLPEGGYLEFAKDPVTEKEDGSILVYDGGNEIIGAINIPWAVDATGKKVETYYMINGTTLTQVVNHSETATYPVLADPYYIYSYFDSGRWIIRDGLVSLSLVPNWKLRVSMVGGALKEASWAAVKKDFYWDKKWYNTQGLYEQYVCHFNFAFFKSEFNLEPSRRSVGYWSTVASKCNP